MGDDIWCFDYLYRLNPAWTADRCQLKGNSAAKRIHTDVAGEKNRWSSCVAAVFVAHFEVSMLPGAIPLHTVTIFRVPNTELDWRASSVYFHQLSAMKQETAISYARSSALAKILPPRYQGGTTVSGKPHGYGPYALYENSRWRGIRCGRLL